MVCFLHTDTMNDKNHFRLDELPPEHPLRQVPFTVPEGYFDQLPTRIQARATYKPKPMISWSWERTAASLAGVGLIALLVWQTMPQRQESLGSEALAGVSNEAIVAYLDDQGINAYELADGQELHHSLGSDTTAIEYLNVQPTDIRQYIDEQTAPNAQRTDS